jgi:hypothetical protein
MNIAITKQRIGSKVVAQATAMGRLFLTVFFANKMLSL